MKSWLLFFCVFFVLTNGWSQRFPRIKNGEWTGKLMIQNGKQTLPFKLTVTDQKFTTHNASEDISLEQGEKKGDSIVLLFPTFNSQLVLKPNSTKQMTGYWINKNKNSKIPCQLNYGYVHRFPITRQNVNEKLSGKWEVTFDKGSKTSYKGQAIINQTLSCITGTIRTETGDFKFLEGNVNSDSIYLSRFDGAHVLLILGKLQGNVINGLLYSGAISTSTFEANLNPSFELIHPDSLTYVDLSIPLEIKLNDINGNLYTYPNASTNGKVVIIELMGSWCPNCLDEAYFLKELYSNYPSEKLEIISVAYEIGDQFEQQVEKVNRMRTKLNLPYTIVIGGKASKQLASQQFPMLNQVMSFPTTLILDKKGVIRKVHTGFNGPATGDYYINFKKETTLFIDQLLTE